MKFVNSYIERLKPYKLASHKIWSVSVEERYQILKLDWNEATMPPSPKVQEALLRLVNEPSFYNLYPMTHNDRLIEALSDYSELPQENIQYFGSSDALHEYICKVFIGPADAVLILGPSYDNFRLTCQANGAAVFYSNYKPDFTFDSLQFEADIKKANPSLIYICNPNNPTGNIHSKDYIESLLKRYPDILFLIDEAYYEFSGITMKDFVLKYDNILISRTMSKAFALANFRVGYVLASTTLIASINKIRNPKNLSTLAQEAAIAALSDARYMQSYVEEVKKGRAFFCKFATALGRFKVTPSAGNFVLVVFPDYDSKMKLLEHLADNNIFVRNTMQDTIVENCFRITCGTTSQMKQVAEVISSYYNA